MEKIDLLDDLKFELEFQFSKIKLAIEQVYD